MTDLYDELETRPYLLYLNQINLPEVSSDLPEAEIQNIAEGLGKKGINFSLPLVCLTEEEDQYQLITGLPIYKAAEIAEVQKIWVFLIAAKQPEAEEAVEQALLQSRHNQRVGKTQDEPSVSKKDFLEFVNDEKSDLSLISGLGKTSAKRIAENRPYTSLEDMQKKLGSKAPLKKWLKAYQQNDNLK
jgi:DNA uptake protein ComE-like DNA-binding protein